MTIIKKIPVKWDGLAGFPGYSLFYSSNSADPTGDLATFFGAIKGLFPTGMSWSIPASGDTVEDSTGALSGTWSGTGGSVGANGGTTTYMAGTGTYVVWGTSLVVGRRRLKGHTFLAPMLSFAYTSGGILAPSSQTTIQVAAATLAGTGKLVIWHRPTKKTPTAGVSGLIISGTATSAVTSLRSRRT